MSNDPRDSGCLCQRCRRRYKVDFMVPDVLWARIHGDYQLLCGICIVSLVEALGQFDYFQIMKIVAEETVSRAV